ncbi:MAG: hypothetical protein K1Y02_20245 [Candidatus Hydrogenedentes bacterium]|nr:hypothetical protein [Candidatus Hydrogenedentota bacterium]
MQRASRFFTDDQRKAIEQAVAEAESKTSAEIVPALTTASGRYDRAEDIIGLCFGVIALAIAWLSLRNAPAETDWGIAWGRYELPALIAALALGWFLGVVVAMRIAWLRRLFTPRGQMRAEVNLGARQMFFDWRVHRTATGAGVLVYISLYERMTVVLADETALGALGQQRIDQLCAELTPILRSSEPAAGLCRFLNQLGDELGAKLPRAANDANELPNGLVLID